MNKALFEIQNLALSYGQNKVLDDVNFCIHEGQMLTVIGENGSGKSSLLNTLAGLIPIQSGTVNLNNASLHEQSPQELAQQISSLGQNDIQIFDMPVWSRIAQGYMPHQGATFFPGAHETEVIKQIAQRLQIDHCLDRLLGQLSGGERRRVHLARALVNPKPQIIILDEPFANIDVGHQPLIVEIIRERQQQGATIICSVQQLHLVVELQGDVLGLKKGRQIVLGPPKEALTEENLERLFSRQARYHQSDDNFHGVLFKS